MSEGLVLIDGELINAQDAEDDAAWEMEWMSEEYGQIHPQAIDAVVSYGKILHKLGKHDDEEDLYRQTLEDMEQKYGEAHLATFWAVSRLALVLSRRGRHPEVDCLLSPNLEPVKQTLGAEHALSVSISILQTLALRNMEQREDFERIRPEALGKRCALLDDEHSLLLETVMHAVESIGKQGSLDEAEELLQSVQKTVQNAAARDNALLLLFENDAGGWFRQQGRHEDAERIHRGVLTRIEDALGSNHMSTLGTLSMIVDALVNQQKYDEAEKLQLVVLERAEHRLRQGSQVMEELLHRMAFLLAAQGKHAREEQFRQRAADLSEQLRGPTDARTLVAKATVAKAVVLQGRLSDAEVLFREVLQSQLAVQGDSHPDTIQSMEDLAATLAKLGKHGEAEDFYRRSLDLLVTLVGQEHPKALCVMNRVADALSCQGLYGEAVDMHYQAHCLMVEALGEEHLLTLGNLDSLTGALIHVKEYAEAEALARRLVGAFEKTFGRDHIWTFQQLASLGMALNLQEKYAEGLPMLRQALRDMKRTQGENDPVVIRSILILGAALFKQQELAEAEDLFRAMVEVHERTLGSDHVMTLDGKSTLAMILYQQGRESEAREILAPAIVGFEAVLGDRLQQHHAGTIDKLKLWAHALRLLGYEKEAKQTYRRLFELRLGALESQDALTSHEVAGELCVKCVRASTGPLSDFINHHEDMAQLGRSAKSCPLCKDIMQGAVEMCQDEKYEICEIQALLVTDDVPVGTNYAQLSELGIYGRTVSGIVGERDFSLFDFNARVFGPENEITARAIYKRGQPPSTLVHERLELVHSWLQQCKSEHTKCSPAEYGSHRKPTRLVDIGCPQDGRDAAPRLVDANELDPSVSVEWTALSHCWGARPCDAAMTTRSNISSRRKRIELASLPQTYRDAIWVTAALGFRFIWIDSLCIIQQDREDWSAEAANMSAIYQNCALVLAAASSADMNGGLSLDSWRQPALYTCLSPQQKQVHVEIWDAGRDRLSEGPLITRGWTLQETLLARRIVYFAADQLSWQCQTHTHTEDGIVQNSTVYRLQHDVLSSPLDFSNRWTPCHHWWSWVNNYTSRKLTNAADYMVAIAGITQYFSKRLDVRPALGLWADYMFAFGLGWALVDIIGLHGNPGQDAEPSAPAPQPTRSALCNIPSWSWLRYQMPIYCALFAGHGIARTLLMNLDIEWAGKPQTSDVLMCRLLVRGPVKVLELFPEPAPRRGQFCSFTEPHQACFLDEGVPSVTRDENGYIKAPCLLLTMQTRSLFATFMVMEELTPPEQEKRKPRIFRRIGVGAFACVPGSLHPLLDAEDETIELM